MTITIDAVSLQPIAAPIAPPFARAPVAPVGDRDSASNERRNDRGDRSRTSAAFRSFLNAATLAGLTQSLGADRVDPVAGVARPRKVPDRREATELSGAESERLYQEAQAKTRPHDARAREALAVTQRYAKSFFSVSGTFAKPGESLELTA